MFPHRLDALKCAPQRDEKGKLWLRLADVLEEFGVNRTNVSFWAGNIRDKLPGSVIKMTHKSGRNSTFCLYVDITGLLYFALRADSDLAREYQQEVAKEIEFPLELGPAQIYDGKEWYMYARLVNTAVHSEGKAPKQTVTTTIKAIPKSETRQLTQRNAVGRHLSRAWHVTYQGALHYVLSQNTPYTVRVKAEIAKELARKVEYKLKYLGAA